MAQRENFNIHTQHFYIFFIYAYFNKNKPVLFLNSRFSQNMCQMRIHQLVFTFLFPILSYSSSRDSPLLSRFPPRRSFKQHKMIIEAISILSLFCFDIFFSVNSVVTFLQNMTDFVYILIVCYMTNIFFSFAKTTGLNQYFEAT